ncbi:hypothetical protein Pcinc_041879, partial [Petrolisthes cinctipes]
SQEGNVGIISHCLCYYTERPTHPAHSHLSPSSSPLTPLTLTQTHSNPNPLTQPTHTSHPHSDHSDPLKSQPTHSDPL